jgi:hypothetical protein
MQSPLEMHTLFLAGGVRGIGYFPGDWQRIVRSLCPMSPLAQISEPFKRHFLVERSQPFIGVGTRLPQRGAPASSIPRLGRAANSRHFEERVRACSSGGRHHVRHARPLQWDILQKGGPFPIGRCSIDGGMARHHGGPAKNESTVRERGPVQMPTFYD